MSRLSFVDTMGPVTQKRDNPVKNGISGHPSLQSEKDKMKGENEMNIWNQKFDVSRKTEETDTWGT